jgi:hypothetical protein
VQIRSPSISVCCQAMENLNSQKSVECMWSLYDFKSVHTDQL